MENGNLCDGCKQKLCGDCKAKFASELVTPAPPGTDAVGIFFTIVGFIFLVWFVVGFAHDCGMATCGRLM